MGTKLGVAIIGAGLIGAAHAQGYRIQSTFPDGVTVSLVKVVDENAPSARSLARRFSFAEHGDQWRDILDDDRVDVVSIAVPNQLHLPLARALLGAGKHVLCEKPLANDARDAFTLHSMAAAGDAVAGTVLNYRRIPAVAAIRELADRGALGELLHFEGRYLADYGCDPAVPLSWRYQRRHAGAGVLTDLGTHVIDLAHALCGDISVVRSASARTVIQERPLLRDEGGGESDGDHHRCPDHFGTVDNEDIASMAVEFTAGSTGQLMMSRVAVGFDNGLAFTLFGRDRTVRFDYDRMTEFEMAERTNGAATFSRVPARPGDPHFANLTLPIRGIGYGYAEVFAAQIHHFLTAARDGASLDDGGFADGYRAALVIEAAQRAAATGASVLVADVRADVEEGGASPREARVGDGLFGEPLV